MTPVSDVHELAHLLDKILLVVEWGRCNEEERCRGAWRIRARCGEKLVGAVLNKADLRELQKFPNDWQVAGGAEYAAYVERSQTASELAFGRARSPRPNRRSRPRTQETGDRGPIFLARQKGQCRPDRRQGASAMKVSNRRRFVLPRCSLAMPAVPCASGAVAERLHARRGRQIAHQGAGMARPVRRISRQPGRDDFARHDRRAEGRRRHDAGIGQDTIANRLRVAAKLAVTPSCTVEIVRFPAVLHPGRCADTGRIRLSSGPDRSAGRDHRRRLLPSEQIRASAWSATPSPRKGDILSSRARQGRCYRTHRPPGGRAEERMRHRLSGGDRRHRPARRDQTADAGRARDLGGEQRCRTAKTLETLDRLRQAVQAGNRNHPRRRSTARSASSLRCRENSTASRRWPTRAWRSLSRRLASERTLAQIESTIAGTGRQHPAGAPEYQPDRAAPHRHSQAAAPTG